MPPRVCTLRREGCKERSKAVRFLPWSWPNKKTTNWLSSVNLSLDYSPSFWSSCLTR
jgi:hypothetical protein